MPHERQPIASDRSNTLSASAEDESPKTAAKVLPRPGGAGKRYGLPSALESQWLYSVLVLLFSLGVWQLLATLHLVSPLALPAPQTVLQQLQTLLTSGFAGKSLFEDIWVSALRIASGFAIAVLIGVPIGMLMAWSNPIFQVIDPFLQFIRPVPPLSYIPLLVVWFGIGELPKVILILLGTLPVIIISTISGVRAIPPQRIRVAQSLGATPLQLFRYTILPSALPEIFTGMRVGIGIAWSCLVAAEFIAADVGLGWLVQDAGQELQVGIIFVGIICIGLLGYLMELVIRLIERLVVPWKGH
ncbi:ABC transporter permease [Ktedonosporobacter rubrisoli]|uniref:ABC transporter permease n=1 Tax=Ktedonosporobacter rubrisoli TaxID=2509675 RepID=A0A4P6JTK4_KTERU|nr:ABC transporter permease [Ktedonosporobacter rubrisoli]QBD78655.1 ABC transporter permease [Ktedonosporobacter rubrisoli]